MCEIPPYLFIFFHLGPTKDTIPITHAEGWHRIHRLSTHTFLTSINRERSSHCKLTVRGAITLDLKKLQFQKMINSCTPTCLMQNYTLEWSIQAICCQSQKKNMLWREICSWQLHLVRAGCNVNRIYSHQTLCTHAMEDHSYQLYHHPTNKGFPFSLLFWFIIYKPKLGLFSELRI